MAADTMIMPPLCTDEDGRERRIGVELEFAGVPCEAAAALVHQLFGGRIEMRDPYRHDVVDTAWGTFTVELDSQYAHPETETETVPKRPAESGTWDDITTSVKRGLATAYGDVASAWLPVEIVSPPVPLTDLPELDRVIPALREAGAKGTDDSVVYAFATQFNPQVPSVQVDSLLRYLRAFLLLAPSLRRRIAPVLTRRMLPFANPFPQAYARRVLDPAYAPSRIDLISDYIAANPTRNRELDLLPVFAHVAPEKVHEALSDTLIRARPTFHYRLPDTRLSDLSWSLLTEWNRWAEVEHLAADARALDALGRAWIALDDDSADARAELVDTWRETTALGR
jgi:hypothetical protein